MTIAVGQLGLDFVSSSLNYSTMAHDGFKFVSRYAKGVGGANNPYAIRPGEIDTAVAHGFDFLANFELSEETPTLGMAEGKRQGAADRDFLQARGYAPGAGVCISWEPGNNSSQWNNVSAFCEGYSEAVGRPVGMYAAKNTLIELRRRGIIHMTWLPMSSSASGIDTSQCANQDQYAATMLKAAQDNGFNFVQNRNRHYGNAADEDVCVSLPSVAWSHLQLLHPTAPAKPAQPAPNWNPVPALPNAPYGAVLMGGKQLVPGQALVSPSQHYAANFQAGNAQYPGGVFVVRNWVTGKADWDSGTQGKHGDRVSMQTDGNLVIYAGNKAVWDSGTASNPGAFLQMQDDGNLVIYSAARKAIWSFR